MASVNKLGPSTILFIYIFISFGGISSESFKDLKAAICGFPNGLYSINDLARPKVWSLNYTDNTKACIGENNETVACEFKFAFCQAYNCSNTDKTLMNASACLNVQSKNKTLSTSYKLGSYNPNVNPFEDASIGAISRFVVHFVNGSPYNTSTNNSCTLQMDMTFVCNQNGLWSQGQGQTTVNKTLLRSVSYDSILCKYNLTFDYNGACPVVVPLPTPSAGLSAGTVLIIIFFVSISVYCILGSTIKCLQGNQGKEILPHSNFWVMLPVYIADGFIFSCEKCCFCKPATDARYDSI